MKKIIAILTLVGMICQISVMAHPFSDVAGHWAEEHIERAYETETVNGDPDGRFRPEDTITRAEFVKLVSVLVSKRAESDIPQFHQPDKMIHWAANYQLFASLYLYIPLDDVSIDGVKPGIMDTYEEFEMPVQRWEMAYMVGQVLENLMGKEFTSTADSFKDSTEILNLPSEISRTIAGCNEFKLMMGDEKNMFNPKANGTRAEAVVVINRLDDVILDAIETYEKEQAKAIDEYNRAIEASLVTYTVIPNGHPKVTMVMENGKTIEIELYPEYAPQTVANFVTLVKEGFYNGLTFHRVVDGFMAQGGDPNGNGMGGAAHNIKGEFLLNGFEQNTLSHTRGVISMARSNHYDSASSQFFICYDDASFLDGKYAAFGKVTKGMEVLDSFLKLELVENNMGELASPKDPIVIKTVTVK